jgi:murein DD-endopeptidase MepM/ murein hydrolase activator NlpD
MPSRTAPQRRRWRKLIPIATATLSLSVGAGAALGQAQGSSGGVTMPSPPRLNDVQCVQTCAGLRTAGPGSVVRLTGNDLENVNRVSFRGSGEGRVAVEPNHVDSTAVRATVPEGAATGKVRVADVAGNAATTPNELEIVATSQLSSGGHFRLREARAAPRKTYFFSRRNPAINYVFNGEEETDIRVDVVRRSDGNVVRSWVQQAREPLTTHTATWNGRTDEGRVAPNGPYRFRVGAIGNGGAETTRDARFRFFNHIFPVRSKQRGWGDGFGAGRGHQGQDIFAPCGTRLVAARGGKVLWNRYQSAAGWYVVISGRGVGRDYVYMHLQQRSPLREGQRVRTGQQIGRVGETGNASGCHLHFELWSGPGWYRGGSALPSVTRHMRRWARWS